MTARLYRASLAERFQFIDSDPTDKPVTGLGAVKGATHEKELKLLHRVEVGNFVQATLGDCMKYNDFAAGHAKKPASGKKARSKRPEPTVKHAEVSNRCGQPAVTMPR